MVDSDEDLVELCSRMQASENRHCAILFCDEPPETEAPSSRTPSIIPTAMPRAASRNITH